MKTPMCLTALTTNVFILSISSNPAILSNNCKTLSHKGLMSFVAKKRSRDIIREQRRVVAFVQR
jgi:hypothetical protein